MKVKVGILTFHYFHSYGAVIQTYALQKFVSNLGVDVEVINFTPKKLHHKRFIFPSYHLLTIPKYFFLNCVFFLKSVLKPNILYKRYKRKRVFNNFVKKHLTLSGKPIYTTKDLIRVSKNYSIIIVGSDQVWNPLTLELSDNGYLLKGIGGDVRKIGYAISIAEKIDAEQESLITNAISSFDAVSFRDYFYYNKFKNNTHNKCFFAQDPPFLLNKMFWENFASSNLTTVKKNEYLLVYDLTVDTDVINLANKVAEDKNLSIISYSGSKLYNNHVLSINSVEVETLLTLFMNARYVLSCSSFHGLVFSLLYEKKFLVKPHKTKGSRSFDLLEKLNLTERILSSESNVNSLYNNLTLNKKLLSDLVDSSTNFLKTNLL